MEAVHKTLPRTGHHVTLSHEPRDSELSTVKVTLTSDTKLEHHSRSLHFKNTLGGRLKPTTQKIHKRFIQVCFTPASRRQPKLRSDIDNAGYDWTTGRMLFFR